MIDYIGNTHVSGIENACKAILQTLRFIPDDSDSYYVTFWDEDELRNDPTFSHLCDIKREEIYYEMIIKPCDCWVIGELDEKRIKRNINIYDNTLDTICVSMYIHTSNVDIINNLFSHNYIPPNHNIVYVTTTYKYLKDLYRILCVMNDTTPVLQEIEWWIEDLPYFDIFIKE